MNEFGFPKYTRSQQIGRSGEAYVDRFVTDVLGWVYRSVHLEADFGIDGFVDVTTDGHVTGRSLAVQIKCGDSYTSKRTGGGIRYEGGNQHLNYYLNQSVPVILIVLSSDCTEGYWVEFDVDRTNETAAGWWIEVPKRNVLDQSVAAQWAGLAGFVEDYSEEVQMLWAMDDLLSSVEHRMIAIPTDEIRQGSVDYLTGFLNVLTKTKERTLANRGKLEIVIPGYDSDSRELYEIPEVRRWFKTSIDYGVPWFYFLDTRGHGNSIKLLLLCTCEVLVERTHGNQRQVRVEPEEQSKWLRRNFYNLNKFIDYHDLALEVNKERSDAVAEHLYRFFS